MGTYLSVPVTEKCEESGESLDCPDVPCAWGVVDMQGWRKSMEDSHIAVTDIPLPQSNSDAKVFGVFDGHGGAEVARFCSLYMVSVLTQQESWKNGDLTRISGDAGHLDGEAAANSDAGKALRSAFHALDRMVDDINRRSEIVMLRNQKPQTGERREALSMPEAIAMVGETTVSEASPLTPVGDEPTKSIDGHDESETKDGDSMTDDSSGPATSSNDDDSNEAVGKEEAAELDQDMLDVDQNDEEEVVVEVDPAEPTTVSTMFQKILALGSSSGQLVVKVDDSHRGSSQVSATAVPASAPVTGPSASLPSLVQNGRMICNLPDHAIHAGATAIVAILTGRVLTVANAGDSRAVLCRAEGTTLALSFDHKPQHEVEMSRITKAGGFVNNFGRVNGNLNLSRSLGDLKYKQVPGISPPDQIITAEPDIVQVFVEPTDEFLILGCDGIWDCLSNENAVKYVRERINSMSPTDIGKAMLDDIISEDPRETQGIGGDNMTIMIIDLQPSRRTWRTETVAISEETAKPAMEDGKANIEDDTSAANNDNV